MVERIGNMELPQQDKYVPIPGEWGLVGQRSVISSRTGRAYEIVEFDNGAGLTIGLFLTDMGRDEATKCLVAKERALTAAIQKAVEYRKNREEYERQKYSKQERL